MIKHVPSYCTVLSGEGYSYSLRVGRAWLPSYEACDPTQELAGLHTLVGFTLVISPLQSINNACDIYIGGAAHSYCMLSRFRV